MPDQVIAKIEKSKNKMIHVSIGEFQRVLRFDIREYYKDEDGEWKPGKGGISLPVDQYKKFASAIASLGVWLTENDKIV